MKYRNFQRADYARAALHDGLILSHDCGLGKSLAAFTWPMLKVGYEVLPADRKHHEPDYLPVAGGGSPRLRPKQPGLLVVPGDLHSQLAQEAWDKFRIRLVSLDSQATFARLASGGGAQMQITDDGRPLLPPDFYIASFTQLTTNGVERLPDADDWADPVALRQLLSLHDGVSVPTITEQAFVDAWTSAHPDVPSWRHPGLKWSSRPEFTTTCEFYAWRGVMWNDQYNRFGLDPFNATTTTLAKAYAREYEALTCQRDQERALKDLALLNQSHQILLQLVTGKPDPRFDDLEEEQRRFVLRSFLAERLGKYKENEGSFKDYPIGPEPEGFNPEKPETDTRPKRRIKCIYSPSLSDLACNAFSFVVIDEAVKAKGAETYVGLGVRQMDPKYRLVLTATPIKNRVPDLFWLAHWATGGQAEAHARFPYRNDVSEQTKFAETFMVSERNLTREEKAKAAKSQAIAKGNANVASVARVLNSKYKKLTAEVCNIHRLWKMLGPILLRRRKDDCGEDIVPKIRRVIRCEMGTHQADVYQYHLACNYTDINGDDAIGARLQALRMAAADPSSRHLRPQEAAGGGVTKTCRCLRPARIEGTDAEGRLFFEFSHADTKLIGRATLITSHPDPDQPEIPVEMWSVTDVKELLPSRSSALNYARSHVVGGLTANPSCVACHGAGTVPLPPRSSQPFVPKMASVLHLVEEILARNEQVLIGSAFNDPLDHLSNWLTESGVRHLKLDGRTSQKKRGRAASLFKRGRKQVGTEKAIPVMLGGVECISEGHSFENANNVILLAYSWAYDKFIQFINRVHRMTSPFPVNVYVVLCNGTIDRKLESLIGDKGDASELVLDGRLLGERPEEVSMAGLLKVAQREFDPETNTVDEALIHQQWPALRERLRSAMTTWDATAPVVAGCQLPVASSATRTKPATFNLQPATPKAATQSLRYDPATKKYTLITATPMALPPPPPVPVPSKLAFDNGKLEIPKWKAALPPRSVRVMVASSNNPWDLL